MLGIHRIADQNSTSTLENEFKLVLLQLGVHWPD